MSTKFNTIHVGNLPVQSENVQNIKHELYNLFSVYGQVNEIRMLKSKRMKGQAFVIYSDKIDNRPVQHLNNFPYKDKLLKVQRARGERKKMSKKDKAQHKSQYKGLSLYSEQQHLSIM